MFSDRTYTLVGLLTMLAALLLVWLAFTATSFSEGLSGHGYSFYADFDELGGLTLRAPVRIAGVKIGEIKDITLDQETYRAHVKVSIYHNSIKIPQDTVAKIMTEGLLGMRFLALEPGYEHTYVKNNSLLVQTRSAMVLENLIGKFLTSMKGS